MANYATLADVLEDLSITVTQTHLTRADVFVDAELIKRGMSPADLTLPKPLLTELAITLAARLACIEQATSADGNSPLISKAREYQRTIDSLLTGLTREALGLSYPAATGVGSFSLGRG
jgi:hypothetical protein